MNPILISSEEAKQKYPYHVLDFYESCLVWESEDEEMDCDDDNDNGGGGGGGDNTPMATLNPNAWACIHFLEHRKFNDK